MFKNLSRSVECMPLWNFDFKDKHLIVNEQNTAFTTFFREKLLKNVKIIVFE